MGFSIIWEDPHKTILRITYTDGLTADEARQAKLQREIMLKGADGPVDIIIDLSGFSNTPSNLNGFMKVGGVGSTQSNYSGLTVMIGEPTLVEQIRKQYPIADLSGEVVVVPTLKAAHERIEMDRLNRTNPF
jgi:hypothetical protein